MLRSMYASVSGLRNHQVRLDIIGNNIANVNTVGYKASRVTFEEAMNQMLKSAARPPGDMGGTNPMQVGLGMNIGSIDSIITQGSLQSTGMVTDLAIEGRSYFVVSNGNGFYYTRDGAFQIDANGRMVLPTNGYVLQGKMANDFGEIEPGTPIEDIKIPFSAQSPAKATSVVKIEKNLDADSAAKGTILYSQRFLAVATDGSGTGVRAQDDYLVSLYNENGESLRLRTGDVLTISGELVDENTGDVIGTINYQLRVVGIGETDPPTTLSDLEDAINTAIASAGGTATISLTADGRISVVNNTTGVAIKNLQVTSDGLYSSPYVATALKFPNLISSGETGYTKALRVPASEEDTITSLYTASGKTLGFEGNDTIVINGNIGGTSIESPVSLSVGIPHSGGTKINGGTGLNVTAYSKIVSSSSVDFIAAGVSAGDIIRFNNQNFVVSRVIDSNTIELTEAPTFSGTYNFDVGGATLADLLSSIRDAFSLPETDNTVEANPTVEVNAANTDDKIPDGAIVIRGLAGKAFALSNVSIIGQDGDNDNNPAPTQFNANMSLTEFQTARDAGQYDTSITVYDESGDSHVLTITFTHTGTNGVWEWKATLDGNEEIIQGNRGQIIFNQDGTPAAWTFADNSTSLVFNPGNGAGLVEIKFDYGKPGSTSGITQFRAPTTVTASYQDGYTTGRLQEISVTERGEIEGVFTNGTKRLLAQIYLASFINPAGLERIGDNVYRKTSNSGDPMYGIPGVSDTSLIKPGALEQSNVDLAEQFTDMIITQRGYQANARVITTSDTMLQELVNLVR